MNILKWAAVAVTALMALMNIGAVLGDSSTWEKASGLALGVLAVVALVGFVSGAVWGTGAVIVVGALNVVASVVAALNDVEGWTVGLVVAALGTLLAVGYRSVSRAPVTV